MILKNFMNNKLAIIGAGGHGKVVGEIASLNRYKVINFFDDRAKEIKDFPFSIIDNLQKKSFQNINSNIKFIKVFKTTY